MPQRLTLVQAVPPSSSLAAARSGPPLHRMRLRLPGRAGVFWVLLALKVPRVFGTVFTIVLRRFLGPGVAVLVAVWGFGTGALVVRELTSVIAGAILLRAVYPLRPR